MSSMCSSFDAYGYNSGNSRNGGYQRTFKTKYGALNIVVPRDRMGEFRQQTLPPHRQSDESPLECQCRANIDPVGMRTKTWT